MRNYLKYLLPLTAMLACGKEGGDVPDVVSAGDGELYHEEIVLGSQLDDPYSLDNMKAALSSLYPTKAGRVDIEATNLYVRFLPETEAQLKTLEGLGIDLLDHPMDYEIVREGDYYHDPEIDDDAITWQYAVVPTGFDFPKGIACEQLDSCYIMENDPVTRSGDGIDWKAVEAEAYRLTGNERMLVPQTRASSAKPAGRITIVDEDWNGAQPFGVAGVKVSCNAFVKFASAYTDRDGYYEMGKKFSSKVRYRLVFKNEKGFSIGLNLVLVPASISTLGKGSAEGVSVEVTKDSDRKLYTRCVVNNSAYDYICRCGEDDMDITAPDSGIRIWIMQKLSSSSTPMLHHGAAVGETIIKKFLGDYAALLKVFLPDMTLGLKGLEAYSDIYAVTCHELAHASHYAQVGNSYWNKYIEYILTSFVSDGGQTYGDGTADGAGYCEVGEMWAYYLENKMHNERYGGEMPSWGSNRWFHPQIFRYLDERGLSRPEIFKALTSDVTDREKLLEELLTLYPEKSSIINQVFERYSN